MAGLGLPFTWACRGWVGQRIEEDHGGRDMGVALVQLVVWRKSQLWELRE